MNAPVRLRVEHLDERGLGLGLSFVNWIAKAHGGAVEVDSKLNGGSRFTVSLPAVRVERPQMAVSSV